MTGLPRLLTLVWRNGNHGISNCTRILLWSLNIHSSI